MKMKRYIKHCLSIIILISLLSTSFSMFVTTTHISCKSINAKKIYKKFLSQNIIEVEYMEIKPDGNVEFRLVDVNGDKIPELQLSGLMNQCGGFLFEAIMTIKNGKVVTAGSCGYSSFYILKGKKLYSWEKSIKIKI